MAYRLDDRSSTKRALRRIGHEQLDGALAALGDDALEPAARVHAVRKRIKRLRGLLRLVGPHARGRGVGALDRHLRDAARQVSDDRDATVFPHVYDRVCERFADEIDRRGSASIRAALTRRARAAGRGVAAGDALARLHRDLTGARERLDAIRLGKAAKGDVVAVTREGFVATHDRARRELAGIRAAGTPEEFHAWRKRVKDHRLHLALLRDAWPAPMRAFHDEARRLGDLLGDAHDLAALDAHLRDRPDGLGSPHHVEAFTAFARTLRTELEAQALPLGERVFAETGARLSKRIGRWWAVGRPSG